jgi:hypothetical protein
VVAEEAEAAFDPADEAFHAAQASQRRSKYPPFVIGSYDTGD